MRRRKAFATVKADLKLNRKVQSRKALCFLSEGGESFIQASKKR